MAANRPKNSFLSLRDQGKTMKKRHGTAFFRSFSAQSKEYPERQGGRRRDLGRVASATRAKSERQAVGSAGSNPVTPTKTESRHSPAFCFARMFCACTSGLLLVPKQREGPGRVPAALPVAGEADGMSVQRKGAVQPAGRNATMRLGFAKSAKR